MSHESICTYCEALPGTAGPSWGGKPGKCPLCKQELWIAQGGATYRLDPQAAPRTLLRWSLGMGAAVGLCVIVALGALAIKWRFTDANPVSVASAPKIHVSAPVIENEGPGEAVQAKTALPPKEARVKPSRLRPDEVEPAVVKAAVGPGENEWPLAKDSGYVTPWARVYSVESLEMQLRAIPQVDLDPEYLKKSKKDIAKIATDIATASNGTDKQDAFIQKLIKDRQEMVGLPFLLGKDCAASKDEAMTLAGTSLQVRSALAETIRRHPRVAERSPYSGASSFWANLDTYTLRSSGIPALHQILQAEPADFRMQLVAHFQGLKDAKATDGILNRALFDLDPEVRAAARAALGKRPKDEYRAALAKALRYPWQPVVNHAAQAVAALEMKEMIPDLIALLDKSAPGAPYVVKENGKEKTMIRELVRVNHHRNCMLCHAVVDPDVRNRFDSLNVPVGPVPSPEEPLPPSSSAAYYAPRGGVTIVRADITYLRQDFSYRQKVDEPGKWSDMQRFDFLIRTRELTPKDVPMTAQAGAEYKEAIGDALKALTGRTAAPTAQAWREALARSEPRVEAKVKPMR